jgi:hypothetical protein
MEGTMKRLTIRLLVIGLLTAGLTYIFIKPAENCVNLYIDFSVLQEDGTRVLSCINVDKPTSALQVLKNAKIDTEGTQKYGDAVLCRVMGLPNKSQESCVKMPSEKAYWAVLVKRKQLIPNPFDINGKWNWATTGINEVQLSPGDSLGLVFADNGKVSFPK